ncbi:MAG: PorT family protein [Melioribacteraceae bacterium]|nr:PorT family protein [Melioribacteraceae bacterium]MCF8263476.1 PorT family protein [Melioribacteraceae bacterium]MCF8414227.1 PorT family protein [Melioribacteraceae bacterium]MCF8431272.1 PorT family protein [Melioribacteraceae bacterium]
MKKLITILLLVAAYNLSAQETDDLRYGFVTGLNYAHFNGSDSEQLYSRATYQIGIYTQHKISDNFVLQPEIILSAKGAAEDVTINQDDLIFTYKFSYIEIPILVKYYFTRSAELPVHPMLFAGPAFSFRLASELEGDLNGNTASQELTNYKTSDVGMVFGGGIGIPVGGDEISIILKYTLGFVQIDQSISDPKDYRNGVFTIGFGYTL